jgi:hypothetical protein
VGEALLNASTGEILSLTDIDLLHQQEENSENNTVRRSKPRFHAQEEASSCLPA